MSTIPTEIGFLHQSEHLDLSKNLFSGEIDIDFIELLKLKVLSVQNNLLQGNPSFIGLTSLGE